MAARTCGDAVVELGPRGDVGSRAAARGRLGLCQIEVHDRVLLLRQPPRQAQRWDRQRLRRQRPHCACNNILFSFVEVHQPRVFRGEVETHSLAEHSSRELQAFVRLTIVLGIGVPVHGWASSDIAGIRGGSYILEQPYLHMCG